MFHINVKPNGSQSVLERAFRLAEPDGKEVDSVLETLESKSVVKMCRDNKGIIGLVKATYEGLRKAGSLEKYRWYPD